MNSFVYRDGYLFAEEVSLATIAERFGTPCYVYSRSMIEDRWHAFDGAFGGRDHRLCYSVKANSNLAVLNVLSRLGSGFGIVSGGELERVLRAGGDASKVVFSGVGKSDTEMLQGLQAGIDCFNIESADELSRLNDLAADSGVQAPIALRVNPDVDPNTHPYIATGLKQNKFGVPIEIAGNLYTRAQSLPNLTIKGVACHIGSQLTEMGPFIDTLDRLLMLVDALRGDGIELKSLDLGGGLGIPYRDEQPPTPQDYVATLMGRLDRSSFKELRIIIEPGRALVGEAGLLLTRVEYVKHGEVKNFAIVDAGVNDFVRPALYDAWHEILPVSKRGEGATHTYDVVGPVCESSDFLGRDRELSVAKDDILAIKCAGAYGACMNSRYNTRPLAAEVMVDKDETHLIRRRETIDEMLATESILPR
jgi:diaminopimelate decarboxylase